MNTSGGGPPVHHGHVFALLGGEPPLLPLTLFTGFGCVQLEQLFKPIGTFSPSPPLHPLQAPLLPPTRLIVPRARFCHLGSAASPFLGDMVFS